MCWETRDWAKFPPSWIMEVHRYTVTVIAYTLRALNAVHVTTWSPYASDSVNGYIHSVGRYYYPTFRCRKLAQQVGLAFWGTFTHPQSLSEHAGHAGCSRGTLTAETLLCTLRPSTWYSHMHRLITQLSHPLLLYSAWLMRASLLDSTCFLSFSSCCSDPSPLMPGTSLQQAGSPGTESLGFLPSTRPAVEKVGLCM